MKKNFSDQTTKIKNNIRKLLSYITVLPDTTIQLVELTEKVINTLDKTNNFTKSRKDIRENKLLNLEPDSIYSSYESSTTSDSDVYSTEEEEMTKTSVKDKGKDITEGEGEGEISGSSFSKSLTKPLYYKDEWDGIFEAPKDADDNEKKELEDKAMKKLFLEAVKSMSKMEENLNVESKLFYGKEDEDPVTVNP